MFCRNCGKELAEGSKFCAACGAPVEIPVTAAPEAAPTPEATAAPETASSQSQTQGADTQSQAAQDQTTQGSYTQSQTAQGSYTQSQTAQAASTQPTDGGDKKIVLQVVAGAFGVGFAWSFLSNFIGGIFSVIGDLFDIGYYGIVASIFNILYDVFRAVNGVVAIGIAVVLLLFILKWNKENSRDLLYTLAELSVIQVAVGILMWISRVLFYICNGWGFYAASLGVIWKPLVTNAVMVGAIFGILYLLGVTISLEFTKEVLLGAPQNVLEMVKAFLAEKKAAKQTAQAQPQAAPTHAAGPAPTAGAAAAAGAAPFYQQPQVIPAAAGATPLQTDRNLAMYILLSIVTCGIYSYYFIYKMAKDVNVACEGDGKQTSGLVAFILLSMITCGIYAWVWYYNLANRLQENAPRYGLVFSDNGTSVLLWLILGSWLCGIGGFVAMNILIKNTNAICAAYNNLVFGQAAPQA